MIAYLLLVVALGATCAILFRWPVVFCLGVLLTAAVLFRSVWFSESLGSASLKGLLTLVMFESAYVMTGFIRSRRAKTVHRKKDLIA